VALGARPYRFAAILKPFARFASRAPSSLAVRVILDLTKVKVGHDMPGHAAECWRMPLA